MIFDKQLSQNFEKAREQIAQSLKPGVPVYLQYEFFNTHGFIRTGSRQAIFYSNGELDEDGTFGIQGNRCQPVMEYIPKFSDEEQSQGLISLLDKGDLRKRNFWDTFQLKPKFTSTSTFEREHSFSPMGPERVSAIDNRGIAIVIIGDELEKRYTTNLENLTFASDSYHFDMSMPTPYAETLEKVLSDEELAYYEEIGRKIKNSWIVQAIQESLKIASRKNHWDLYEGTHVYTCEVGTDNGSRAIKKFSLEEESLNPRDQIVYIDGRVDRWDPERGSRNRTLYQPLGVMRQIGNHYMLKPIGRMYSNKTFQETLNNIAKIAPKVQVKTY